MKNGLKNLLEFVLVVILVLGVVTAFPSIFELNTNSNAYLFVFLGAMCAVGAVGIVYRWIKNYRNR